VIFIGFLFILDRQSYTSEIMPALLVMTGTYGMYFLTLAVVDSLKHPIFTLILRLIGLVSTIIINIFKKPSPTADGAGVLMMVIYYTIFFA
jgi:hypothetical protein